MDQNTVDLNALFPTLLPYKTHEYEYTFTVFVPAYNAENSISKTLKSIENQSFKDFELIIINDGSRDKTSAVVQSFIKESTLQIRFLDNKVNKNRMYVYMQAVELARGRYFLAIDSDDVFYPRGLEILKTEYDEISKELKPRILGVSTLIEDQNGKLVGDKFPQSPFYSTTFETKHVYQLIGDKLGFVKTDILRQLKFPIEFEKGGFYPSGIPWLLFSKEGYKIKYVNIYTYTYYMDTPNSMTKIGYNKYAQGYAIYSLFFINTFYKDYLFKVPKQFVKRVVSLLVASRYYKFSRKSYLTSINSDILRILAWFLWPFRKWLEKLI